MKEIVNAIVLTSNCNENKEFTSAFASDMMSDVLAYANCGTVLITGLNNPQVVRTAEMMDIAVVLFVRGKKPTKETIDLAEESGIIILATEHIMFEACGKLYENGLRGSKKYDV